MEVERERRHRDGVVLLPRDGPHVRLQAFGRRRAAVGVVIRAILGVSGRAVRPACKRDSNAG